MKKIAKSMGILAWAAGMALPAAGDPRCVMSLLTTCSALTQNHYPGDSTNWFNPAVHSQIVFYAYMLFPLRPDLEDRNPPSPAAEARPQEETGPKAPPGPWHPPLVRADEASAPLPTPVPTAVTILLDDRHYAEADWIGPDDQVVASFGQTMPARASSDYLQLQGRTYIPHTFAMAIGIKDVRTQAGQKSLPLLKGIYPIRFYVDGKLEGMTFFSMVGNAGETAPVQKKLGYQQGSGDDRKSAQDLSPTVKDLLKMLQPGAGANSLDQPPLPSY
jgi:hypothetical protein